MINTIQHQDSNKYVVVGKLLTGFLHISSKVADPDKYIAENQTFDAGFVAHVLAWQGNHGLTPDGIIGPNTWTAIAKDAPTCSTSKNKKSGPTMALQILLDSNLVCDAVYGARTKAAVSTYQDSVGLKSDGVCGPKTWQALIVGKDVKPEPTPTPGKFTQPVDYKQGAKPWGPWMYSNHNDPKQTMANSGCGPTAMADVVATLKDKNIDPYDLAMLAVEWGDRSYNAGTNWSFFPHIADYFKFVKMVKSKNLEALKACLDAGGYVVCSMGKGYWTTGGHYICAWKYDSKSIYCNDPASSKRKSQNINDFMEQRKQFFCFYPDPQPDKEPEKEPVKEPDNVAPDKEPDKVPVSTHGEKIIDISRYNGTINWDKLAPELAFVIIKASGLYKNGTDTKYVQNVAGAVSHGVPFHAYSFLYALTEEEAKRDAKLFYDSVMAGGHMPLFWVLDCEGGWGIADKDAPHIAKVFEDELRRLAGKSIKVAIYVANQKYKAWAMDYSHYAYVWIPKYTTNPPTHKCDLWQYTSTGSIAGISGNVDLNKLMGTKPLAYFLGEDVEPGTEPVEPTYEQMVEITGSTVNIRESPGVDGKQVGVAMKGYKMPFAGLTAEVDGRDWYEVIFNGKEAWVSSKYSKLC